MALEQCPTCGSRVRVLPNEDGTTRWAPVDFLAAFEIMGKVARSHNSNASPELRGAARRMLGGGQCAPWQECPRSGSCEVCGMHGEMTNG